MASSELAQKLQRRQDIIDVYAGVEGMSLNAEGGQPDGPQCSPPNMANDGPPDGPQCGPSDGQKENRPVAPRLMPSLSVFNPYTEFKEFSRKQIKEYENTFKQYDVNRDKYIDLEELKKMMEKLGAPQTHLGLKAIIREVDEDGDHRISFREFLLIFRKAAAGELLADSPLAQLASALEVDVDQVGVSGAKTFFEAKIDAQTKVNKFEREIREEQEEKRRQLEEAKERRDAFKQKAALFQPKAGAC